jgi:hypothetical protein
VSADTEKRVSSISPSPSGTAVEVSNGEFFTVQQIAVRWNLSPDKVRRVFAREPDVLVFDNRTARSNKRRYSTVRIPKSVLLRVEQKYSIVESPGFQSTEEIAGGCGNP